MTTLCDQRNAQPAMTPAPISMTRRYELAELASTDPRRYDRPCNWAGVDHVLYDILHPYRLSFAAERLLQRVLAKRDAIRRTRAAREPAGRSGGYAAHARQSRLLLSASFAVAVPAQVWPPSHAHCTGAQAELACRSSASSWRGVRVASACSFRQAGSSTSMIGRVATRFFRTRRRSPQQVDGATFEAGSLRQLDAVLLRKQTAGVPMDQARRYLMARPQYAASRMSRRQNQGRHPLSNNQNIHSSGTFNATTWIVNPGSIIFHHGNDLDRSANADGHDRLLPPTRPMTCC